jgi:hypothetical protein
MHRLALVGIIVGSTLWSAGARADDAETPSGAAARPTAEGCLAELAASRVPFRKASRKGIAIGVEVTGPVGGVTFTHDDALVLDCSLVVSLAHAAPYLTALGVDTAHVASGYSRRNVRGTSRPSKHSYGLAVDVSRLSGAAIGTLRLDRDYEQGLGDAADCIGAPITEGGATLKIAQCQLVASGLFHLVLSPDYDDAHHDHFHLEVRPWTERDAVTSARPAIH